MSERAEHCPGCGVVRGFEAHLPGCPRILGSTDARNKRRDSMTGRVTGAPSLVDNEDWNELGAGGFQHRRHNGAE